MPRSLFRIVRTDPPTIADFTSNAQRGLPPPQDPTLARLWDGLSSYNTAAQARRNARKRPTLGRYIAELRVPDVESVRVERTLNSPGHHTIWGDPADLLALVVNVEPV